MGDWVSTEEQSDLLDGLNEDVAALNRAPDDYFAGCAVIAARAKIQALLDSLSTVVEVIGFGDDDA